VSGFRVLMVIAAVTALASAASSWFFIGKSSLRKPKE
jgi:hypothetical protein